MLKKLLKSIVLSGILCMSCVTYAHDDIMVVSDPETETVIEEILNPIFKVAGVHPKIYLVQNKAVNAFATPGDKIFIHTGLITHFPDPDVLKGVVAHELGHVLSKHSFSRSTTKSSNSGIAAVFGSIALGTALLLLSDDATAPIAGFSIGMDYYEKNFMKYSRTQEASADQIAFKLLEESHNTCAGLDKLMHYFMRHSSSEDKQYSYYHTHPLPQDRLDSIEVFMERSKYHNAATSDELRAKYARVAVKIAAFTNDHADSSATTTENTQYAEAVRLLKKSDEKRALEKLHPLLHANPNDPFLVELKAQILLSDGDESAIDYYEKASDLFQEQYPRYKHQADELEVEHAVSIAKLSHDEKLIKHAIVILSHVSNKIEQKYGVYDSRLLQYLAICYGKINSSGERALTQAKIHFVSGDTKRAKLFAQEAKKHFTASSKQYIQAEDILERIDD